MPKLKNGEIFSTYQELVKVKKELRDLEDRKKLLKFALVNSILAGSSKAGIIHTVKPHVSIAWKRVSDEYLKSFIPKTKQEAAKEAIKQFKTTTSISSFKEEKK